MQTFFFWLFATVSVLSASTIILAKRPTRALLSLLLCMICLTGLYTLLHAYFVAIVHLIVYAGAVMVLFLFVIMLEGLGTRSVPIYKRFPPLHLILVALSAVAFIATLVPLFARANLPLLQNPHGTVENVGLRLFSNYLLPFELIAVLILLGIFAALALAGPTAEESKS